MCGICGVYAYGRSGSALDGELLAAMAATMSHRGPDDAGVYLSRDRRMGFGFRRLAIVDRSAGGRQPMSNEDGSVTIVLNGEIYNHREHRPWLESRGHRYRGRADAETVVHLYEEYGAECLHYLRGMFAFAIWDEVRGRLFIARDRLGIKPLYYMMTGGHLIFGSEIKALLAFPGTAREVDCAALCHYLTFMAAPAPLTMFRGIRKLPAGHYLTVDSQGDARMEQYWDPAAIADTRKVQSDERWAERMLDLLRESVRLRMMSDVPLGVLLSGGVDSSLIAALTAEASDRPIDTFSVGFKAYPQYSELDYARQAAERVGGVHHEIMIDHRDALDYLPRMVDTLDEPIGDWVCVPLYFVSRLARQSGVTVTLVGEGADELFCGYPLYLAILMLRRWRPLLAALPESIYQAGAALASRLRMAGIAAARKPERLLQVLEMSAEFWGGAISFRPADKRRLLATPLWQSDQPDSAAAFVESVYSRFAALRPEADPLTGMTYLELRHRLPELLLMRIDKIAMSTGVEARVPFLDHRLVELALAIPQAVKIRGRQTKAPIKRAAAGLLPETIIRRKKQGFAAPVSGWFRKEMAGEVRATLLDGLMVKRGYFNRSFVARLLSQHQSCGYDRGVELWSLYNAEMWYRRWID